MKNKVTLSQIANKCHVSKGLVSRALANKYNVGADTAYKIKQTAIELGYDFKKLKISKKSKRKILILCPSRLFFKEFFWQSIIKSISTTLSKKSIIVDHFIYDETHLSKESLSSIKANVYQGFIIIHYNSEEIMKILNKTNIPTVIVDPKFFCPDNTTIKFSNFDSFYKGCEYLISLGHKKIAFYGDDNNSLSFKERHQGYLGCMEQYKLKTMNILFDNQNKNYSDDNLLANYIKKNAPTAILCANDIIALNAYNVIKSLNLKIPNDISIIGFDNIDMCNTSSPKLTTFNVNRDSIGEEAANYMIDLIERNKIKYSQLVMSCEFINRESVKGIK